MRRLYLHLPRFPVQRKVREAPYLAKKPLVLWLEEKGARKVAFCSSAALAAGVRVGLSLSAARALCDGLESFAFEPKLELAALASLAEALLCLGPSFQLDPPEGLWLDASAAPLQGSEEALAQSVLESCAAQGYLGRVAVASESFSGRALARHGKSALAVVPPDRSAAALASLPLLALEEEPVRVALARLGLHTLGELAALPAGAVLARLGVAGVRAQRACRAQDAGPWVPEPPSEVLEELFSLEWPAESLEPLLFASKILLDRLCARLQGRGLSAVRLKVSLELDPRGSQELFLTLARPSAQARHLLELLRHRYETLSLDSPVRAVRMRVEKAGKSEGWQLSLGEEPTGDAALEVVLARLTDALGEGALFSAAPAGSHRPERAYALEAFCPPVRPRGLGSELAAGAIQGQPVDPTLRQRPSRLFPQAQELGVELGPDGEILSAKIFGRRRRVLSLSGPERLCGEWWDGPGFERDYYRVCFEGLGPVWIFQAKPQGQFYLQGLFD